MPQIQDQPALREPRSTQLHRQLDRVSSLTGRNASTTVQLASAMQETTRTTEDLASRAGDLRTLSHRFRSH